MKNCCIVIPIYNTIPTREEIVSLKRNIKILKDYDIFFIHPFRMDVSAYEEIMIELFEDEISNRPDESIGNLFNDHAHFKPFKAKYFKSNKTYSRLMLSEEFYRAFFDYEYMLIAQTDTYILNTERSLGDFIDISRECSYDYWGAPWPNGPFWKPYTIKDRFKLMVVKHPETVHVGNGGFSLRHVMHSYELVHNKRNLIDFYWRFNEDLFFSWFALCGDGRYRTADRDKAALFALEGNIAGELEAGNIPYAVHAWNKYYSEEQLVCIASGNIICKDRKV